MTSTNTYQWLESTGKPSSRGMQSSGGGSSNIFDSPDLAPVSNRTHRMSSNIFGSPEEPQNLPKRSNPPGFGVGRFDRAEQNGRQENVAVRSSKLDVNGGKESGIFREPDVAPLRQRTNPPGGKGSDIFGDAVNNAPVLQHPNKPKDNIALHGGGEAQQLVSAASEKTTIQKDIKEEKKDLGKEDRATEPAQSVTDHEPRLGPRPRSHNKVINPPGGKSSITFY
ncbi:jupiter microtubule associated homolog 2 isoform X1 [Ambystoma mexicanum]|uniref:jupiter microtubule associated homolog 2 isoform X1 n=1 Tax=Ambystoma mexicanum TaxID=8296 RepID=UPI0037E97B69